VDAFPRARIARMLNMSDALAARLGLRGGDKDRFAALAARIGLHNQDSSRIERNARKVAGLAKVDRMAGFIDLAVRVFDDSRAVSVEDLTNLRRLRDLIEEPTARRAVCGGSNRPTLPALRRCSGSTRRPSHRRRSARMVGSRWLRR
jgi:hypothetical protein